MKDGDERCVLCRGERGWWPAGARRCLFHPGVAAQHYVCRGCAEAHGLGEDGFLLLCPKSPEIAVGRAVLGET